MKGLLPEFCILALLPSPAGPLRSEILAAGGWLRVTVRPVRLRHDAPTEAELAVASFKAAVALASGHALAIAGEPLTAAAAQHKLKG